MVSKKCSACSKDYQFERKKINILFLKSRKSPYEKKIALYNCLKNVEVGELEPIEKERIDYLFYGEIANQNLKKYKRLTVKDYSKEKK